MLAVRVHEWGGEPIVEEVPEPEPRDCTTADAALHAHEFDRVVSQFLSEAA